MVLWSHAFKSVYRKHFLDTRRKHLPHKFENHGLLLQYFKTEENVFWEKYPDGNDRQLVFLEFKFEISQAFWKRHSEAKQQKYSEERKSKSRDYAKLQDKLKTAQAKSESSQDSLTEELGQLKADKARLEVVSAAQAEQLQGLGERLAARESEMRNIQYRSVQFVENTKQDLGDR